MKKKTSFAARLSARIILITSIIFLLAIGIISAIGVKDTWYSSMDYSTQILKNATYEMEISLQAVKLLSNNITSNVQNVQNSGAHLDTANFFKTLTASVSDHPYLLGAGVFYLPYKYDRKLERAGIYVNRILETGTTFNEWDDNQKLEEDGWDYFDSDWYKDVVETKKELWVPPFYEYNIYYNYVYLTSFVAPIFDKDGTLVAVSDIDMSLEWLQNKLLDMLPYQKSNIIVLDRNGDIICNPIAAKPYEGNVSGIDIFSKLDISGKNVDDWDWENNGDGVKKLIFNSDKGRMLCLASRMFNGWYVMVVNRHKDVFYNLNMICILVVLISLAGLAVLFFTSRRIIKKETLPLTDFAHAAGKITDGRFDIPIPQVKTNDEIFELGNALQYMQSSVTNYIEELKVTTSEKERLAGELDIARKIQMQMLNRHFLSLEGCGLFATSIPAHQVGGDLYDFYVDGDYINYIIADVSGKGVPAALLMSISISAFRATIRDNHSMSQITNIINSVFCNSNHDNMFITVNVGRINYKTGETEFCNAGHNPMILISPEGKATYLKLRSNIACGAIPDFKYKSDFMTIEKGSRLLIYTDGVTEAENSRHEQYSTERLLAFAEEHGKATVPDDETVINDLAVDVQSFVGDVEQSDDITVMTISL